MWYSGRRARELDKMLRTPCAAPCCAVASGALRCAALCCAALCWAGVGAGPGWFGHPTTSPLHTLKSCGSRKTTA